MFVFTDKHLSVLRTNRELPKAICLSVKDQRHMHNKQD